MLYIDVAAPKVPLLEKHRENLEFKINYKQKCRLSRNFSRNIVWEKVDFASIARHWEHMPYSPTPEVHLLSPPPLAVIICMRYLMARNSYLVINK